MPPRPELLDILRAWVAVNSGTANVAGVRRMAELTAAAYRGLAGEVTLIDLPPRQVIDDRGGVVDVPVGPAVKAVRRPDAGVRVLLVGHLDTVFPADGPFQTVREVDDNRWVGPGVADLKGGLVVMLEALRRFEASPHAQRVGWTVLLNPDEEVGSPSSSSLLAGEARNHDVGLVYEPALADGRLAGSRGGSANFDLVIRGRSAHVGREFDLGRSAIHVAAEAVQLLASFNAVPGVTVNVGRIDGGGPANRVADLAVVRMNVRVADDEKQQAVENDLRRLTTVLNRRDGMSAGLHGRFFSPPKPIDGCGGRTLRLFETVRDVGQSLGIDLTWADTGGVCDGNKLQAAGLPTVDTLGVRGGGLHTHDEFVLLDSIEEQAALSALLLERLATEGLPW